MPKIDALAALKAFGSLVFLALFICWIASFFIVTSWGWKWICGYIGLHVAVGIFVSCYTEFAKEHQRRARSEERRP